MATKKKTTRTKAGSKKASTKRSPKKKAATRKKAVKKKAAAKKRSATKKKVAAKKRSATKKKVAAKKRSATKKKTAAKKKPATKKRVAAKKKSVTKKKAAAKQRSATKKKTATKQADSASIVAAPPPAEGSPAPEFSLPSDGGGTVSLSDFRGDKHVVLYFYPRDNTPGCTIEAHGFRDRMADYEARDAVVLGVSRDSVKSHDGFKAKQNLNFPLLSDPDAEVIAAYGSWGPKKFMGRSFDGILRTTVVIDKEGVVRRVFPKVSPKTHADEVLAALDEIA